MKMKMKSIVTSQKGQLNSLSANPPAKVVAATQFSI